MTEPQPEPTDQQPPKEEKPLTSLELRKDYTWRAGIVLLLFLWFVRDGWFNPEIHSISFNRLGAFVLGCLLIYLSIRMLQYHLAWRREVAQGQNPADDSK